MCAKDHLSWATVPRQSQLHSIEGDYGANRVSYIQVWAKFSFINLNFPRKYTPELKVAEMVQGSIIQMYRKVIKKFTHFKYLPFPKEEKSFWDFCFWLRWNNRDQFTLLPENTAETDKIYETMICKTQDLRWRTVTPERWDYDCPNWLPGEFPGHGIGRAQQTHRCSWEVSHWGTLHFKTGWGGCPRKLMARGYRRPPCTAEAGYGEGMHMIGAWNQGPHLH